MFIFGEIILIDPYIKVGCVIDSYIVVSLGIFSKLVCCMKYSIVATIKMKGPMNIKYPHPLAYISLIIASSKLTGFSMRNFKNDMNNRMLYKRKDHFTNLIIGIRAYLECVRV